MMRFTTASGRTMVCTNMEEIAHWLEERKGCDIYRIRAWKGHPMHDPSVEDEVQLTIGWGVRGSDDKIYHIFVKKYDA